MVEKRLDEIMKALRGKGVWSDEIKARRKDGSLFDVQVSAAMVRDREGNPVALTSTSIDITERKLAEEALRESEEKLKSTISSMDDLVFVLDKDGVFSEYYRPSKEIDLYIPPEAFVGKSYREVMPPNFTQILDAAISTVMSSGTVEQIEYSLEIQEVTKWYSAKISPKKNVSEEFTGTTIVARDITERKKVEEEREKLISDLQAALAEIKTLSGIIPICAKCKKIRDDKGYWNQVEVYIRDRTEAEFSHGLCPECVAEMEKEIDEME